MTSDRFERVVFIALAGEENPVPAGLFTLDTDTGVGRFSYGRRYLERPNAIAIDPVNLPLTEQEFVTRKNQGLFGIIADVLPDSWGKYILAKRLRIPFGSLNPHEMLDLVTTNGVGALAFGRTPERAETRNEEPVAFTDLARVADAFEQAVSDQELPAEVLHILAQGTSLGGAQPKCPVKHQGRQWIAKFENSKTPVKFPRIEYATMQLARLAGLTVPEVALHEVAGKSVYLVERFDRQTETRLPFMSGQALTNLDIDELEKGSYVEIARLMRGFVKEVNRDLHELYRRMIFNVMVGNRDDHLRNHGFLFKNRSWKLSPLYDVVPIPARPSREAFSMSLSVGDQGSAATMANLLSRAEQFHLNAKQAEGIIQEVNQVTRDWQKILRQAGVEAADLEAVRWSFEGFREMNGL